jgi:hypothetical protein
MCHSQVHRERPIICVPLEISAQRAVAEAPGQTTRRLFLQGHAPDDERAFRRLLPGDP